MTFIPNSKPLDYSFSMKNYSSENLVTFMFSAREHKENTVSAISSKWYFYLSKVQFLSLFVFSVNLHFLLPSQLSTRIVFSSLAPLTLQMLSGIFNILLISNQAQQEKTR